jgi:hypothetical protein
MDSDRKWKDLSISTDLELDGASNG